jgi:hypothetical protein
MADKQKKMLQEALQDARLETELPKKYDNPKVGSVDRPIPRTARLNMLESVRGIENPDAKKYIEYADREAREAAAEERRETRGKVPSMKKGGKVKSASSRADGCAQRGKTRGKMV